MAEQLGPELFLKLLNNYLKNQKYCMTLKKSKVQIKMRGYKSSDLKITSDKIYSAVRDAIADTEYIEEVTLRKMRLPNTRRIYCVLRSPHVDKDSREHFEIRTCSGFLQVTLPETAVPFILDKLRTVDLPAGISCTIK